MPKHPTAARRVDEEAVPRQLVEAIASELWALYGKSGRLDREGAERGLARIAREVRALADAQHPEVPTALFPL